MSDVDLEGQRRLDLLITNMTNSVFDDWEYNFIRTLIGKKYIHLTTRQKAIINRLYGWLNGLH